MGHAKPELLDPNLEHMNDHCQSHHRGEFSGDRLA